MDGKLYSKAAIDKYMNANLFFNDEKLKKYYTRDEARDLGKFRKRVADKFSTKTFDKFVYVCVTDITRDIILATVSELSQFMQKMGDLIVSGGEAFNMYMPYDKRIVTTDIDAKFVPRVTYDAKYFGKLQAIKLIMWDKLGQIAQRLNTRIKTRVLMMDKKVLKYMGIGFKRSGPYVTRRYTLIKKKKTRTNNKPAKGDVFIDVELFALDLNIRFFSPEKGKIDDVTLGGLLDIPFMRPREFGYDVIRTLKKGVTYRNAVTNKMIINKNIYIASKEFLIDDIYLMYTLKLRPEKLEKDRQRLLRLAQMFDKRVKSTDSIDAIFNRVKSKLTRVYTAKVTKSRDVSMKNALQVDPRKYTKYTTEPSRERLSKQIVHGVNPVTRNAVVEGYERSNGNQRFNLNTLRWKRDNSNAYTRNEFALRPIAQQVIPKDLNVQATLYGFKPRRDGWVPKPLLQRAAAIPFIGLKK
jgi:hypothetical protein|tara:strand:+ start:1875 stop:3275 length:1401 start_codon:yes stop_codon:yes gene_type:complete